jgi:hypothetical protein
MIIRSEKVVLRMTNPGNSNLGKNNTSKHLTDPLSAKNNSIIRNLLIILKGVNPIKIFLSTFTHHFWQAWPF